MQCYDLLQSRALYTNATHCGMYSRASNAMHVSAYRMYGEGEGEWSFLIEILIHTSQYDRDNDTNFAHVMAAQL